MLPLRKTTLIALAVSFAGARGTLCADEPATSKPKSIPGAQRRLDDALQEWDKARQASGELHQEFTWTRTDRNPFTDSEKLKIVICHGEIWVKRPDHFRVEERNSNGEQLITVLCIGDKARVYFFTEKKQVVFSLPAGFRLPQAAEQRAANNPGFFEAIGEQFVWLLLGPPSSGLNQRFMVRLEKEDDYWSYIRLDPIRTQGWMDYQWQFVLDKKNRWLRRVCQRSSSDVSFEITVDFKHPVAGELSPGTWNPPFKELPKGWKSNEGRWQ